MGRNRKTNLQSLMLATTIGFVAVGCQKKAEDAVTATPKTLYVASGTCYSGSGITAYTAAQASRAVTKWSTVTGSTGGSTLFTDLNFGNNVSVNTNPQALIDNGDHMLMLTENATTGGDRKVFRVYKNNPSTYITYATDPTAFVAAAANVTRSMALDVDGTLMFSRSAAAERLNTLGVRIVKGGANAWVSGGITGSCFTAAATQIQSIALMTPFTNMNNGKMIYIHAGATAVLNRIGITARTGLTTGTAADCVGSSPAGGASTVAHTNAPNLTGPVTFVGTGASLTSMVYIPTPAPATTAGKLLVTYSASVAAQLDNNTTFNHGVVMWDITETSDTAATITNPVILWRDESVVFAPSAITYDATDSSIYVAVGGSPGLVSQSAQNFGYNVEKFTLDMATPKLTRVSTNNQPFIIGNAYTKCISNLTIGD